MKDKDVKKLLSKDARSVLPDDGVKEEIKERLGYGGEVAEKRLQYAGGGEAAAPKRNMIVAATCALAFIIALCIALTFIFRPQTTFPGTIGGGNKFEEITDADSFYAYGAASVGSILASEVGGAEAALNAATFSASTYGNGSGGREWQIQAVNRYMPLVESLLSDSAIVGAAVQPAEGYDFGMTVSYKDLLGNTVGYTMYYNKQFVGSETDEDEYEENYSIVGVLIVDGVSYPVEGEYETETSSDESGDELRFRAYTSADRRSYIEVEQEYETESEDGETETEKEYVYSVYIDGEMTERTEVEYEREGDELEVKLTYESGGVKDELVFESIGEALLEVRGKIDDEDVRFRIRVEQGQYRYEFEDGTSSDFDRFGKNGAYGGQAAAFAL